MERKHLKKVEDMEKENKAEVQRIEGKLKTMEETQIYRMQSVEDKVRRNEESHNRHIEQLKGEVHTLSCEHINSGCVPVGIS